MGKKGQVSVEYIMIIAISLTILIPSALFFKNYVFESNDKLIQNRLNEVSSLILLKAKKVHYFGPPSKMIFRVDMPSGITNMYVLNISTEYYLVFRYLGSNGEEEKQFDLDIPIRPQNPVSCGEGFACKDTATCTCFISTMYSKGGKNFQAESMHENELFYVSISGDRE